MASKTGRRTPSVKQEEAEHEIAKADIRAALEQSLTPKYEAVRETTKPNPRPVEKTLDPTEGKPEKG
jgi:hypothetical protein